MSYPNLALGLVQADIKSILSVDPLFAGVPFEIENDPSLAALAPDGALKAFTETEGRVEAALADKGLLIVLMDPIASGCEVTLQTIKQDYVVGICIVENPKVNLSATGLRLPVSALIERAQQLLCGRYRFPYQPFGKFAPDQGLHTRCLLAETPRSLLAATAS
jgi:hypothetical protein